MSFILSRAVCKRATAEDMDDVGTTGVADDDDDADGPCAGTTLGGTEGIGGDKGALFVCV